jgi:uncharacterized protein (TIGR02391 family)
MAKRTSPPERKAAQLSQEQMLAALPLLERRIADLKAINVGSLGEDGFSVLQGIQQKIDATLLEVYGASSIEYHEYRPGELVSPLMVFFSGQDTSFRARLPSTMKNISSALTSLETAHAILKERLEVGSTGDVNRIVRAYEGLNLHHEIARAASKRYQDGHYADAVEAAVKALNNLVRLRSGSDLDGTRLMESVFSPNNPVLKFNSLVDQSDKDEQKGFMMMFSGAVAGLRNPRAHKFIQDDPERALEFIAYVSLLAKLLDGTTT